jgi:hypothetical protein
MTAPWLTGPWQARFRTALFNAFSPMEMQMLTSDFFRPDTLYSISPVGVGTTYEFQLFQYVDHARMNGFLPDLVRVAHERRPKNEELGDIADDIGLTSAGPRLENPTHSTLEELIQENALFINPAVFRERLPALEGQVCKVEIPGGGGTGFLIGRDLVLTNQHVIKRILDGKAAWSDVVCLFDYRQTLDGTVIDVKRQTRVKLVGPNWLQASLPPSQYDFYPQLGEAALTEADCAVIQLATAIGELPIGGQSADPLAPNRGWIDLATTPPPVAAGNQLFILQHPDGDPMQLTIGKVTRFNATGTRMRYDANSKAGSSGAPCFNADLQFVALHHSHDPATPPTWNQGVPLALIQPMLRQRGFIA